MAILSDGGFKLREPRPPRHRAAQDPPARPERRPRRARRSLSMRFAWRAKRRGCGLTTCAAPEPGLGHANGSGTTEPASRLVSRSNYNSSRDRGEISSRSAASSPLEHALAFVTPDATGGARRRFVLHGGVQRSRRTLPRGDGGLPTLLYPYSREMASCVAQRVSRVDQAPMRSRAPGSLAWVSRRS